MTESKSPQDPEQLQSTMISTTTTISSSLHVPSPPDIGQTKTTVGKRFDENREKNQQQQLQPTQEKSEDGDVSSTSSTFSHASKKSL